MYSLHRNVQNRERDVLGTKNFFLQFRKMENQRSIDYQKPEIFPTFIAINYRDLVPLETLFVRQLLFRVSFG